MTSPIVPPLKRCHKCGQLYPLTDQHFRRNRHGNLGSPCRNCIAEGKRKWRSEHPELVKRHKSDSQKRHRDSANARNRKYEELHSDRLLARRRSTADNNKLRARLWYANNRERALAQSKEYNARPEVVERRKARNRGKYNPNHALVVVRYRARQRSLPDIFTAADWRRCLEWWGHKCAYCGATDNLSADHFIPLASPDCPGTVVQNMLPACKPCNSSKGHSDPIAWLAKRLPNYALHEVLAQIAVYFDE